MKFENFVRAFYLIRICLTAKYICGYSINTYVCINEINRSIKTVNCIDNNFIHTNAHTTNGNSIRTPTAATQPAHFRYHLFIYSCPKAISQWQQWLCQSKTIKCTQQTRGAWTILFVLSFSVNCSLSKIVLYNV